MKRRLLEQLETRKEQMIAALWSNPNFDGAKEGENPRIEAIEALEQQYADVAQRIIDGTIDRREEEEEEIDYENNPFWKASKRGVEKIQHPRNDEGTVKEALESEGQLKKLKLDIDQ